LKEKMPVTTMIENASGQSTTHHQQVRARKRMDQRLAPVRPTAKASLVRPPDYQPLPLPPIVLALILVVVLLVTLILLAANLSGTLPSWWPTWTGLAATVSHNVMPAANAPSADYTLRLADDFSQNSSPLMQGSRPNEWRTELLPAQSVYAIEVSPNHLAWSLLGVTDLKDYRLQTSVLVDAETPGGYAGLIFRYQDDRHFYLLSVDGNGRYQIQQQKGDEVVTVQPWVMAPFLNRAGSANLLTIEDDGGSVRFYGNNMRIAELSDLEYPLGFVGLAGGALGQAVADIRFDWFQLYDATTSK
jgi:hypothetical protein